MLIELQATQIVGRIRKLVVVNGNTVKELVIFLFQSFLTAFFKFS